MDRINELVDRRSNCIRSISLLCNTYTRIIIERPEKLSELIAERDRKARRFVRYAEFLTVCIDNEMDKILICEVVK